MKTGALADRVKRSPSTRDMKRPFPMVMATQYFACCKTFAITILNGSVSFESQPSFPFVPEGRRHFVPVRV